MNRDPICSQCGHPVGPGSIVARMDVPVCERCRGGFGDGVTPDAPEKQKKHEEEINEIHKRGVIPNRGKDDLPEEPLEAIKELRERISRMEQLNRETSPDRKDIMPGDQVVVKGEEEYSYGKCHCLWLDDMQGDIMVDVRDSEGTLMQEPVRKVEKVEE